MSVVGCFDCIGLVAALVADGLWAVTTAGQCQKKMLRVANDNVTD